MSPNITQIDIGNKCIVILNYQTTIRKKKHKNIYYLYWKRVFIPF